MPKRDERGRFIKGGGGGPGRPPRHTEADYIDATISSVSLEQWEQVVQRTLNDALAGDRHARRFLADYLLGRPTQTEVLDLRSNDAALIAEVLKVLQIRGILASDLFNDILRELDQLGAENGGQ